MDMREMMDLHCTFSEINIAVIIIQLSVCAMVIMTLTEEDGKTRTCIVQNSNTV